MVPKTRFAFGIARFDGTQNAFCLRVLSIYNNINPDLLLKNQKYDK
jgi:hypothetical protein